MKLIKAIAGLAICGGVVVAADWPNWGRDGSRNMVSQEKGLIESAEPGKAKAGEEEVDPATTKNVKWTARLGGAAYGNTTVGGGHVYVGTNNDTPRDPRFMGDYGVLLCLDEKTGAMLWQFVCPKLGAGGVSDFEHVGFCSSPAIDGDRLYAVTNRCEVICLTTKGLGAGNEGPFKEEGQYAAGPGGKAMQLGKTDADIVWRFDMRDELGVFPHNMTSSSVLVVGDRIYATTSNGRDWTNAHIPAPTAPALICLDKKTGKLLGQEASGISKRTYNCNWSSPAYAKINGREMIIFGGGDGFCYGFEAAPTKNERGADVLKEIWRFDCNPASHKEIGGKPLKYGHVKGPSEIIATPVVWKNRVYIAVGQDPEKGDGVGCLSCIDATKSGDITESGKIWQYEKISRSMSTVSIIDGLLTVAEFAGRVHCLDPQTGAAYWTHDTEANIWGSTLIADGKIYVGNESGDLTILAADKEKKEIGKFTLEGSIMSTPVAANGVLFVSTEKRLYAFEKK